MSFSLAQVAPKSSLNGTLCFHVSKALRGGVSKTVAPCPILLLAPPTHAAGHTESNGPRGPFWSQRFTAASITGMTSALLCTANDASMNVMFTASFSSAAGRGRPSKEEG